MSLTPRILAVTFAVFVVPRLAAATDYYVATTGHDATPGGTMAAPWATLQYAADHVAPGDTVHVADGGYVGFDLRTGGTASAPIVFIGDGTDVRITSRNANTADGINVENADYVTIDNFITNGLPRAGVRCAESAHVTIRRIRADANAVWGIFTGCCPAAIIEDNITSHSVMQHGIYYSNSADDVVIRRNVSFGNTANGIHMNGDMSTDCTTIPTDGVISRALVERNIIYSNGSGGGSGINCDGVSDSIIQDNLIYDELASGISLYQGDAATGAQNDLVVNNTILQSSSGRWAININSGSTGATIRNNILFTAHSFRGVITLDDTSLPGFNSDYNIVTPRFSSDDGTTVVDLAAWQAMGFDTHSATSTPAATFVNVASNDYHLAATASAVDHGEAAHAPPYDLEGHTRPFGSAVDIGAYEFGSTSVSDAGTFVDASTPMDTGGTVTDTGTMADTSTMSDGHTDGAAMADITNDAVVGDAVSTDAHGSESNPRTGSCGCRTAGSSHRNGGVLAAALVALACVRRRRRHR